MVKKNLLISLLVVILGVFSMVVYGTVMVVAAVYYGVVKQNYDICASNCISTITWIKHLKR